VEQSENGMTANEKTLATFETRLRQMLLRFQELKKENGELSQLLENNKKTVAQLQAQLNQKQSDYDSLKMAKMIEITDGNLDGAKERLSKLIREVNKCIAILSDDQ
jgi:chromosome segregation ATPase